jgi:hypothetical protein
MKSLFDKKVLEEVIQRIGRLTEKSKPQWGQMTVYQMLKHCAKWEEMRLGKTIYKQSLLGMIVGRFALKDMLKDEPVKHNIPTIPALKVTDNGDWMAAKQDLLDLLAEQDKHGPSGFLHPFFGKLNTDEAGRLAYKHIDHHLRQFVA